MTSPPHSKQKRGAELISLLHPRKFLTKLTANVALGLPDAPLVKPHSQRLAVSQS